LESTPIQFAKNEGVDYGGVLFLLPALVGAGLLSYRKHYTSLSGYYDLNIIILSLAFLYLCRIKNPEQTKHISPGEFGKLLGLDRIPEPRSLRAKIKQIVDQGHAKEWNQDLASRWVKEEENTFYYIDGHVQVYSGYKANLGKKHISRLKLCLPGMTEFWVNNCKGMPYFVVTGEVNEKLKQMLEEKIIPILLKKVAIKISDDKLESDPDLPRFTLVFDREAYSPKFFSKLWKKHRIAILTYRKNVKDTWPESNFTEREITVDSNPVKMKLAEKKVFLNGCSFREVRKLSKRSHQTSIMTNNKKISTITVADKMFSRWCQENFFKYLRQEYDLDKIAYYIVNELDNDIKVVNPIHSKITYKIKRTREKISRRKAKLYELMEENITEDSDKTESNLKKQSKTNEELQELEIEEEKLVKERKKHPYKIKIEDMEEKIRYNKLDLESKLFQNIIKMICYRAETNFSILLSANYKKKTSEMRALTKSLINTKANIIPNEYDKTLTIELYSLANNRDNTAAKKICKILNDTETIFPGTNLRLFYKFATN